MLLSPHKTVESSPAARRRLPWCYFRFTAVFTATKKKAGGAKGRPVPASSEKAAALAPGSLHSRACSSSSSLHPTQVEKSVENNISQVQRMMRQLVAMALVMANINMATGFLSSAPGLLKPCSFIASASYVTQRTQVPTLRTSYGRKMASASKLVMSSSEGPVVSLQFFFSFGKSLSSLHQLRTPKENCQVTNVDLQQ